MESTSQSRIWMLLVALTFLTIGDYTTTQHYLSITGLLGEANVAMRSLAEHFGIGSMLIVKLFTVGFLAVLVPFLRPKRYRPLAWILLILCFAHVYVIFRGMYAISLVTGGTS